MRRTLLQALPLMLFAALAANAAHAQDSSPITDRFALRAIFFHPVVTSEVRLDAHGGVTNGGTAGTPLSGERDFGFQSRPAQGRMELMFRLAENGRVRFSYFSVDRSGDAVQDRVVNFGDDVFRIGDRVASELDWRDLQFTYTYSFIHTSNVEVGFGAGIDAIQARAVGRVRERSIGEEATGAGAFPTAVLDGTWAISKRFALTGRVQYFSASVGKFSGSLAEYHTDLQYRWRKNLQMGIGYTVNRVILDVSDGDFPGRFGLYTRGPEAFLRASF